MTVDPYIWYLDETDMIYDAPPNPCVCKENPSFLCVLGVCVVQFLSLGFRRLAALKIQGYALRFTISSAGATTICPPHFSID